MSFQPWQIFTLLFGISAAIIRYFSSFLMTVIVSVAFGGLTEVVSKYLYVWKSSGCKGEKLEQKFKLSTVIDDETDEELEEKYANIEVNFDESETRETRILYFSHHSSINFRNISIVENLNLH